MSDTATPRLFIPIVKVDAERRLVYGEMTSETVDGSDEIWDYDGSKPYFEAWTANAEKNSGGKSLGNVRSMHQPIAAGKLTQFVMDDDTKQVLICAKVVDDTEWKKVEEGVYTGFSQGGRYVKRWKDPTDSTKTRYISDPVEVSLVDLPCVPTSTFEYIKMDGSTELRKFTSTMEGGVDPTNEQIAARATELAKAAGDASKWPDHLEAARAELTKAAHPEPVVVVEPVVVIEEPTAELTEAEKAAKAAGTQETDTTGMVAEDTAAAPSEDDGQTMTDDEKKAKTKKARDSLVQKWHTPDGQHFTKAADAVAHVLGEPAPEAPPLSAVQAALKAAGGDVADEMVKFEPTEGLEVVRDTLKTLVSKSLYSAGRALEVLDSVISLQCCAAWETEYEKDGSTVPGMLATAAASLGAAALAMANEEVAEALASMRAGDEDVIVVDYFENAAQAEFVKGVMANDDLMKAGARNSKKDKASLQQIHDEVVKMGADCGMEKMEVEELAKMAETSPALKKLLGENETLRKDVGEAVEGIGRLGEELTKLRTELTTLRTQPVQMAPRTNVVSKTDDAAPADASGMDVTKAQEMITALSKTTDGQRMLAEAAIRASQAAT